MRLFRASKKPGERKNMPKIQSNPEISQIEFPFLLFGKQFNISRYI
jgi:hypothetical protein